MRRQMMDACLSHLEHDEYSRLEVGWPRDLGGALISAAIAAIPPSHPDQYQACRDWLATLTPTDREPGWLARFAELLLAAREQNALAVISTTGIEFVWLLQLGYMLALEINTGLKRPTGSVLILLRRNSITERTTQRAALRDIVQRIRAGWPQYEPSPTIAQALRMDLPIHHAGTTSTTQ